MSERIFNVSRSTKTGKTVNVGDFPTVEQAQAAMLSHYKVHLSVGTSGIVSLRRSWKRSTELRSANSVWFSAAEINHTARAIHRLN